MNSRSSFRKDNYREETTPTIRRRTNEIKSNQTITTTAIIKTDCRLKTVYDFNLNIFYIL